MKLGDIELTTISGGEFRIDGGTMFGVVPKVLWSRVFEPDEKNLIAQDTNCVLVQTADRKILIDTGYGSKLSAKQQRNHSIDEQDPLRDNLAAVGVSVEEIDTVVLSHLHFDHAGGATCFDEAGGLVPTFPNAEYVVQRTEWVTATAGYPELRGVYSQDNILPLAEASVLRLIDGDVEIVPGISAVVTGGHTAGHAAILIESQDQTAIYLGDLCPTRRHLPSLWGLGYDVDMLQVRRKKRELLGKIAEFGWLALFDHDPDHAAAYLTSNDEQTVSVEESFQTL